MIIETLRRSLVLLGYAGVKSAQWFGKVANWDSNVFMAPQGPPWLNNAKKAATEVAIHAVTLPLTIRGTACVYYDHLKASEETSWPRIIAFVTPCGLLSYIMGRHIVLGCMRFSSQEDRYKTLGHAAIAAGAWIVSTQALGYRMMPSALSPEVP